MWDRVRVAFVRASLADKAAVTPRRGRWRTGHRGQQIETQQLSRLKEPGHVCVTYRRMHTLTARAGARVEVLVVIEPVSCRAVVVVKRRQPSLSLSERDTDDGDYSLPP